MGSAPAARVFASPDGQLGFKGSLVKIRRAAPSSLAGQAGGRRAPLGAGVFSCPHAVTIIAVGELAAPAESRTLTNRAPLRFSASRQALERAAALAPPGPGTAARPNGRRAAAEPAARHLGRARDPAAARRPLPALWPRRGHLHSLIWHLRADHFRLCGRGRGRARRRRPAGHHRGGLAHDGQRRVGLQRRRSR